MPTASEAPPAVAVVGSTTVDRIINSGRTTCKIGGVTTYSGLTYRRLGVETHIVSNIAATDDFIAERLAAAELEMHLGASVLTTRFVNSLSMGARRQEMPAAADPIGPDQLSRVLGKVNWLHLGPLHPSDLRPELLDMLRQWQGTVVLDVQGYTRRVAPGTIRIEPACADLLPAALRAAGMVKANQFELDTILAGLDCNPIELMQAFEIEELVATRAARGGAIWSRKGPTVRYAAPEIARTCDPTGAGDVFFAAYVASRLTKGDGIESAARRAAMLAARQVAGEFIAAEDLALPSDWDFS